MNFNEIMGTAGLVIAVLTSIGWAASYKSIRNIISNARELVTEYKAAMEDKELSQAELEKMLPNMIAVIEESASIWKTAANAFFKVFSIFKK